MNRKSHFLALAVSALNITLAADLHAGFTVTQSFVGTSGGYNQFIITAINTGGDTGTQIKGLEYFYQGGPAPFDVTDTDEDGTPDTVNLASGFAAATRTRVRVATSAANNVYVGLNPPGTEVQPNPYVNGLTSFSGAIANIGTTQATGTGYQIAKLFVPVGEAFTFSGNIGGDVGTKVPFSVGIHFDDFEPPTVTFSPNQTITIDISPPGLESMPDVTVTATDNDQVASFVSGAIPSQIADNLTIAGTGVGPKTISGGGFTYADLGTYQITFTAEDRGGPSGPGVGVFTLNIVPEPAFASLGLLALVGRRRSNG